MEPIRFSIIIPVYNVKEYLKRCVDSAVHQTYTDINILLIDDGSTDGSGEMCDQFARHNERISVIHQKNAGLSVARNTGIQHAQGEYILFLDGDDYITLDCCERFSEILEQKRYDIVTADAYTATDSYVKPKMKDRSSIPVPCNGRDFLGRCIENKCITMCAPLALYRRDLIVQNELWFEPGILHEDQLWTPQVFLAAKSVTYIHMYFYYHWVRAGSITHSSWNERHYNGIMTVCKTLYPIFMKQGEYREIFLDYLCMLYMDAVNQSRVKDADKQWMKRTAYSKKNRMKVWLYGISPDLYFAVNALMKKMQGVR